MKQINLVETLSPHKQRAIKRWYAKIVLGSVALLFCLLVYTGITIYYIRVCNNYCVPCLSPDVTKTVQTKYEQHKKQNTYQTQVTTAKLNTNNTLQNYVTMLDLFLHNNASMQPIDLQLTPTGVKLVCSAPQYSAAQQMIEKLNNTGIVEQTTLESLEKKNNAQGITCTILAQWKKTSL